MESQKSEHDSRRAFTRGAQWWRSRRATRDGAARKRSCTFVAPSSHSPLPRLPSLFVLRGRPFLLAPLSSKFTPQRAPQPCRNVNGNTIQDQSHNTYVSAFSAQGANREYQRTRRPGKDLRHIHTEGSRLSPTLHVRVRSAGAFDRRVGRRGLSRKRGDASQARWIGVQ